MDFQKASYFIKGCDCDFVKVDWAVYSTTKMVEDENGQTILVPRPCKYDGSVADCGEFDAPVTHQRIIIKIPDELFDVDMEYVCVRQNEDTALEIVPEEDIKEGDIAARILLPRRYFLNKLDFRKSNHPDSTATIKDVQYVSLDLFVDEGLLYLAHW